MLIHSTGMFEFSYKSELDPKLERRISSFDRAKQVIH